MAYKQEQKHWLIRVKDGKNFRNSKMPFWGGKKGRAGCYKSIVKKFNKGDILWFLTSKNYGGQFIGMAEYTGFYDRDEEPIIGVNTYSNKEQNWEGDDDWSLQIHYTNLYITERQNIKACIQCSASILDYDTFKDRMVEDLPHRYSMFKCYAEPKSFPTP